MSRTEIYLDHLASTPIDAAVLDAMLPWLGAGGVGNPHAANSAGWRAAEALDRARAEVAKLIGATAGEIVFTSGATESNNLALLGAVPEGWQVIVSAIEHPSVINCLPTLALRGHPTTKLPVDPYGFVDVSRLSQLLAEGPAFVSVMSANNEVGSFQALDQIAALCRQFGATLHVDAAQSLSTCAMDVAATGIDLLSLSGHKLYGPMGIGALFVRDGLPFRPMFFGGKQQSRRRSGTVPTALAVGLGAASRLAQERRTDDAKHISVLKGRLDAGLAAAIPDIRRNSPAKDCLPGCLNVSIDGVDAADMLLDIPSVVLSTGSACGNGEPSHVLAAMGHTEYAMHGSIRFGIGRTNTGEEIDMAIDLLTDATARWRRANAPLSAA